MPKSLENQSALDRTLAALSEPTRRRLLERLGAAPRRASDLGRGLGVSRPAISKHLSVLRRAGLVAVVPRGRERFYGLSSAPRGLRDARAYLERVNGFWDRALESFKAFAEREARNLHAQQRGEEP